MSTATVTSKGQVTIPVEVRRNLGLKTGSRIEFILTDAGIYQLVPVTGTVKALRGIVPRLERTVTLEEMDEAIAAAAVEAAGL